MPLAHTLLASHSTHLCRMLPVGLLAGSHSVWATSLNTEIPGPCHLPGTRIHHPFIRDGRRIGPTYVTALSSPSRQETHLTSSIYPEVSPFIDFNQSWATRWEQKVPGLRVSRNKVRQPSQLLLPPQSCQVKRQTRVETHVLLFLSQFLQKGHHFLISQVTGTLPLRGEGGR